MRNLILTEEETSLICQIAYDLESGNHLIYPRSDRYREFFNEFIAANASVENGIATEKQKQIVEYHKQCTDYEYWNSLSDEEKMF